MTAPGYHLRSSFFYQNLPLPPVGITTYPRTLVQLSNIFLSIPVSDSSVGTQSFSNPPSLS
jgi:hypothetical protein